MKRRPLLLRWLVGVYLVAPILGVAQIYYLTYGNLELRPLTEAFYSQFTPVRILILVMYPLVALSLYQVKKLSWWFYTAHSIFLIGLNGYEIYLNRSFPFGLMLFVILGGFGLTIFYYRHSLREFFYNPRMRWWEVADRYSCFLPIRIQYSSEEGTGYITDISKSGFFVYSSMKLEENSEFRFESTQIPSARVSKICSTGEVVRYFFEPGINMLGYGVRITRPNLTVKQNLIRLINHLRKHGLKDRYKEPISEIRKKIETCESTLRDSLGSSEITQAS